MADCQKPMIGSGTRAAILALLPALVAACARGPEEPLPPLPTPGPAPVVATPAPGPLKPPPGPVPSPPPPPEEPPAGPVSFRIGGREYTEEFVRLQYAAHVALSQAQGISPADPETYRQRLIDELLLLNAAQRHPSTRDPVFLAQVEAQRRQLIDQQFVDQVLCAGLTVADEEVEAHYRANIDRYTVPEQVRVRQMQFPTMREAEEALRRLSVGGEDFDLVAQSLSIPATDAGWFSRGQMDLSIEQAAFSLEVGEISSIIPTELGYVILLKVGSIPGRVRPLSDVAAEIRAELIARRRERLLREFLVAERLANGFPPAPALVP